MAKEHKKNGAYSINEDDDIPAILSEPSLDTYSLPNPLYAILENASQKPESQLTAFEKMHIVKDGVSKKDLELLKSKTDLDYTMLAKALSVTRATLINKKRGEKFNVNLSERIVGMADLYSYGFEVFESEERFNHWMAKPNKALAGKTPYDLIDNQFGREEVKNLIGRIDYGIYS